uniref:Si:ch211-215a10.4 n=1 Tax=Neogobius melanostomus TaxID=47308 RepID=A0A8C6U6R9_9GOBI
MAVNRGGVAFCIARACSQGGRQPLTNQQRVVQRVSQPDHHTQRPLSSASWALAPPNSLRYQNAKRPALFHPFHHDCQPQRAACCHDDEWVESFSVFLVVRRSEAEGLTALLESKRGEASGNKSNSLSFPLTIVDGAGLDDISVGNFNNSNTFEATAREHGCFRSLFEAEKCPAPFVFGSHFYCFHCPPAEPLGQAERARYGLDNLPVLLPSTLCGPAPLLEEAPPRGDSEEEQKLALMYERLRIELPGFFRKSHDYTMYSLDVEFVNGLLNTKTRGRVLYQLNLTFWRLLCLCYYADTRLEVLKLTKHPEDGTIQARWRLRGMPYHSLLLRFYLRDKSHLYRSLDAFSTFYIGQDGLIHCHKVEKVMPARPPVLPRVTSLLAGALVALGLQEHRPALNLLPPLLLSLRADRD